MNPVEAWTRYWRSGSACLPNAAGLLAGVEAATWREVATGSPKGARALDLATGDGVVAAGLKRLRPDLKVIGVDSASCLPPAPPGVSFRAGVSVEALPFEDKSFELVTSRFGVEYADLGKAAREAARVLRPGGRLIWMCHHAGSAIVRHNMARREALAWAAGESGLLERARAIAAARRTLALPTPPSFRAAIEEAGTLFPDQSVGAEFATAVLRGLGEAGAVSSAESIAALDRLKTGAAAELARLDALAAAALDEIGAERAAQGLTQQAIEGVCPASLAHDGAPYAWILVGQKR